MKKAKKICKIILDLIQPTVLYVLHMSLVFFVIINTAGLFLQREAKHLDEQIISNTTIKKYEIREME